MNDKSSPNGFFIHEVSYKHVLMNWLLVIADFHSNYNRLVKCLNAYKTQQGPSETTKSCEVQLPVGQLVSLLNTMQQELERLATDMEQYQAPLPSDQNNYCTKLANHTQTINELNKQAQCILQLSTLPALQK